MDFKLLDSQTKLMAVSILKEQPIVFASGLVAYTECKKPGGKVEVTRLHAAMRGLSADDLVNADVLKRTAPTSKMIYRKFLKSLKRRNMS